MSIFLLMLWPLFCAFATYFIPKLKKLRDNSASIREMFAIIGCAAELLLVSFLMTENVSVVMPFFDGVGLVLSFSGANSVCCFIVALVWLTMTVFGRANIRKHDNAGLFYLFSFFSLSSAIGYFLSTDFIASLLFFTLGSIFTYPALICSNDPKSKKRAMEFALSSIVSFCLMFFGMSLIHYQTNSLTYASMGTFAPLMNEKLVFLAAAVIFFAFLIRSLFFPLLFRKTSEDNSPALLSLIAIESMIGLYGIFNVTFYMMPSSSSWHLMILIIGSVLLLSGALISLLSSRLDRMIIFSHISSLGCTLIGISLYPSTGTSESIASSLIHLFTSTIAFTLVLSITSLMSNDASKMRTASLRGFYHNVRAISLCFLSASLGIAGVPAWSGYIGHALINDLLQKRGIIICSIMLAIAGGFTVAAFTRAYVLIFLRRPINASPDSDKTRSHDFATYIVGIISALILPLFGVFPNITVIKLANRILTSLRRPAILHFDILASETLSFELLTVVIGALIFVILDRFAKPDDFHLADPDNFTAKSKKKGLIRRIADFIYDFSSEGDIKITFKRVIISLCCALLMAVAIILLLILFIVVI